LESLFPEHTVYIRAGSEHIPSLQDRSHEFVFDQAENAILDVVPGEILKVDPER